jgi:hypothetical protein
MRAPGAAISISDVDTLRGNISEIGPVAFFLDTSEFRR